MEQAGTASWHDRLRGIAAAEGDDAAFGVLWDMLHARVFVDEDDEEGTGYATLNIHQKTIWLAGDCIGDVMNGGFDQFYANSSSDNAMELPDALERLGAARALELFQRAARILSPDGVVPATAAARKRLLRSMFPNKKQRDAAFDAIDEEFYGLDAGQHPDLVAYALQHADAMDFSTAEFDRALEEHPQLLFPADRRASAECDPDTHVISIEVDGRASTFPLSDLQSLAIVKVARSPGASGLVYRLTTTSDSFDVPFFAKGDDVFQTVGWPFVDLDMPNRLEDFEDVVAEARSPAPMEPIALWKNEAAG